jgi:hypothetical protein
LKDIDYPGNLLRISRLSATFSLAIVDVDSRQVATTVVIKHDAL